MSPDSIDTLPANKSIGCLGNAPRNSLSFLCRPLVPGYKVDSPHPELEESINFDGSLPCFVFPSSYSFHPASEFPSSETWIRSFETGRANERKGEATPFERKTRHRGAKKPRPRRFSSRKRVDANREMQNGRRTKGISRAIEGCQKVRQPTLQFLLSTFAPSLNPSFPDLPDFALTQPPFQRPPHPSSLSLLLATGSKFGTQYNGTVISNVISTMEQVKWSRNEVALSPSCVLFFTRCYTYAIRCSYEAGGLKVIKKIGRRRGWGNNTNSLENFVLLEFRLPTR